MRTKEFPRSSTKADSSSRDDSNPKKKAIDLFCGAGGASEGLHRAGFEVTGVDIVPQPDYPFDFILADALSVPLDAYDFIWASPPCKKHTSLRHLPNVRDKDFPDLVTPTCKLLRASGRPYCIENVPPAPLREDLRLCGTTFGLGTADGAAELRRHRVFEIGGFPAPPQPLCKHGHRPSVIGIYGSGKGYDRQGRRAGQIHPIPEKRYTQRQCDEAMEIGWMRMEALSQAVPPAYSQYIAEHFLRTLAVGESPQPQAGKAAVTFRWPGGKAGLAPLIISHAPRSGRKFIDLFGGRGNVTFRAWFENLQFEQWILNDPLTTPFFRALRDYQNVERMVVPQRTRTEFDKQAALAAQGDHRALLLEPWLVFNGGLYSSGGFSTTGSRRSPESYKANLIAGHHVIVEKNPRITSLDWFDCLEAEELDERDFVMVDPSYVSGCVSPYTADSVVHTELIEVLKSARSDGS